MGSTEFLEGAGWHILKLGGGPHAFWGTGGSLVWRPGACGSHARRTDHLGLGAVPAAVSFQGTGVQAPRSQAARPPEVLGQGRRWHLVRASQGPVLFSSGKPLAALPPPPASSGGTPQRCRAPLPLWVRGLVPCQVGTGRRPGTQPGVELALHAVPCSRLPGLC